MNALTFGAPEFAWAFLLLPLFCALYVFAERRARVRLRQFASPILLAQLTGAIDCTRRVARFVLLVVAFALAIAALMKPRLGYTYDEVKRRGLDVMLAVDTSRSMLSNDVQPNRLQRVKLATQDLVANFNGDRVGLIAFAGRAFVQAPLTIDYSAAVEAINDLDTQTIPEGGTNISEAIALTVKTFGKSALGNRALIIFTDGEELNGDATKEAKAAADAGVRVFTVGIGTPQGSLIPLPSNDGSTAFVKDAKGQVVKSKLDEKRLRDVAETTGGIYLHLENGPATMRQLYEQGLAKLQAGDIDAKLSRRPIERFEWPLGAAILALATAVLLKERRRVATVRQPARTRTAVVAAAIIILVSASAIAASPGLAEYERGEFEQAYKEFDQTLRTHPQNRASDRLAFDAGAAAYKLRDYDKALQSFSQALLSPDRELQSKSRYNLGNTLYQRGDQQKGDDKKLADWTNSLSHYEETLRLDPANKEAKENYDYVKRKIEELKNKQNQPPTPTPSPSPQQKQQDKKNDKQQQNQDQQQQGGGQQQEQDKQQDQQDKKSESQSDSQSKSGGEKKEEGPEQKKSEDANKDGSTPSPSPGASASPSGSPGTSPASTPQPSPGASASGDRDSRGDSSKGKARATPTPSPGEGDEPAGSASPTPAPSPGKRDGDLKSAGEEQAAEGADGAGEAAAVDKPGEMSEREAQLLLQATKDEEARVQLDERKARRRVYNDW